MNTFDFLRRYYKSSESTVIICNATKISLWFINLDSLSLIEDELLPNACADLFGKPIYQLVKGEHILNIGKRAYTYNVKTLSDKANSFVVAEIRTESINSSFVNSDQIAELFSNYDNAIKVNTKEITYLLNKSMDAKQLTQESYDAIIKCTRNLLQASRIMSSVLEIKGDLKNIKRGKNSISSFAVSFVELYAPLFKEKNIDLVLNCLEDIYAPVGKISFDNLCTAILNRLLCISDGYIDTITISLDMIGDGILNLLVFTESDSQTLKVSNRDDLKKKLEQQDAIGSDLFAIKYFCEGYFAEATQKVNSTLHNSTISVKIPNCEIEGVTVLKSEPVLPQQLDIFSNQYIGITECLSYFK
jgi:hypothetical protein